MRFTLSACIAAALMTAPALVPLAPAFAADAILSGAITSAAGEKMGGVTVSAKPEGATITTTVFTDADGRYFFPPMPGGKYRVWAQAVAYDTAKQDIDLAAGKAQDFTLKPAKDYFRQLPGDLVLAALPEDNDGDKKMKRIVRTVCTGCHTPSYVLQHRFDEAGWNAILELMKHVNVYGIYQGPDHKATGVIDYNQKELAAYLAKARGPGEGAMKVTLRPRPSGEAARVVFREYDVPIDPDAGLTPEQIGNDGSDWSLGTPSTLIPGYGVHDAWLDLDGNIWFTCNVPNRYVTMARIDTKTGVVKPVKVNGQNGLAAPTHGLTRDPNGILWFNINPGKGGLGRLDPKTEKVQVYIPPQGMAPTGGATTVDFDGKGFIWSSSPFGALRFDPETEKFIEFKSVTYKTDNGTGVTYGLAADRDGNGWWAEMTLDIIGKGDPVSGKASEIRLPPVQAELDRASAADKAFYASYAPPDFNSPFPWSQGPRRMGTDKNADVLWVGNSWGANLARIDTKTQELSFVPLPGAQQPYHAVVDAGHNVWTNAWMTDQVLRYDPAAKSWTAFDMPTRGSEARYVSLLERDGKMQVVLPYFRARKVAVMSFRSEADLAALKAQAGQ
ncbi:MAG TPA: carboxypeptidase regulatory-like domain-containing protein [Xanthobacteraceae bacterium]|nr:carboxypeptidase regulatory-like domain-containing protein [Xanthobacteraceae bacterium]